MLPELNKASVHMKDRENVLAIVRNMINSGCQRLQVISDFDMTLSRFVDSGGIPCHSSYCAMESSQILPPVYRESALKLKKFYYPIEVDPSLSIEEKYPLMVEWWTKAHDLVLQCNFQHGFIAEIVKDSRIFFRDGCDWLFHELHKHNIPLLIFSAGIGDIIVEAIKQRATMYDNIKVVSNFMEFDDQGVVKSFKGELLHIFNKNENAVHKSDYFEKVMHRDNIILLGDSLGDLRMAEGAAECANLLTVGFLNDKVSERLSAYMDAYDIVLVSDQSMELPNAIVQLILNGGEQQAAANDTTNCVTGDNVVNNVCPSSNN